MRHFFWQHEFIPIKVEHLYAKSVSVLTESILADGIPVTQILRKCDCGKLKVEMIKGNWSLEDIS